MSSPATRGIARTRAVRLLAAGLAVCLVPRVAFSGEAEIVSRLCADMDREVATGGGSRADCADGDRAYEVDFSLHWAAAVGQALYYGRALGKRPTVVLICEAPDLDGPFAANCRKHAFRAAYGVRGAADVLLCPANGLTLDDCQDAGD